MSLHNKNSIFEWFNNSDTPSTIVSLPPTTFVSFCTFLQVTFNYAVNTGLGLERWLDQLPYQFTDVRTKLNQVICNVCGLPGVHQAPYVFVLCSVH